MLQNEKFACCQTDITVEPLLMNSLYSRHLHYKGVFQGTNILMLQYLHTVETSLIGQAPRSSTVHAQHCIQCSTHNGIICAHTSLTKIMDVLQHPFLRKGMAHACADSTHGRQYTCIPSAAAYHLLHMPQMCCTCRSK